MPIFLKRFKDKHQGVPVEYFDEDFYNLIKDKIDDEIYEIIMNHKADAYSIGYGDEYDKYLNDKWNETLDKMIFLFNECNKDDHRNEYQEKCFNEAMALFIKYFDGLWW